MYLTYATQCQQGASESQRKMNREKETALLEIVYTSELISSVSLRLI